MAFLLDVELQKSVLVTGEGLIVRLLPSVLANPHRFNFQHKGYVQFYVFSSNPKKRENLSLHVVQSTSHSM